MATSRQNTRRLGQQEQEQAEGRARGDKGRRIEAGCRHTSLPRAGKASMAMPSMLTQACALHTRAAQGSLREAGRCSRKGSSSKKTRSRKNACRLLPPLGLPSAQSRRERAVDPACRLSSAHALCGHDAGHRCSRPCPAGCSSTTGCPGRGNSGSGRGCCGGHRRRGRPTHIFLFPGRTQGRLVSAGLSLLCLCPM